MLKINTFPSNLMMEGSPLASHSFDGIAVEFTVCVSSRWPVPWAGCQVKRTCRVDEHCVCHISCADFSPLTNKIRLSKFEDPIGFTQRFMSWAESHAVTRRILQEAVQKCKAFTCRRRVGQGSYQERWKITRTVSGDLPLGEGQESMMQGAGVRGEGPGDRLPHWFLPENSRLAH